MKDVSFQSRSNRFPPKELDQSFFEKIGERDAVHSRGYMD
jgi:hypothetical protein